MPPGRAGRTWLSRRLQTARHGASLLDRKLRILRPERERFRANAEAATLRWGHVLAGAEEWALRAALLAGSDALHPPYGDADARVDVSVVGGHGSAVPERGARRAAPVAGTEARCPRPRPCSAPRSPTARRCRPRWTRRWPEGAARALDEEVAATRFRLRAVQDRWVPRLEQAAAALDLALAEAEGADAVRLRLAADRRADRAGPEPLPAARHRRERVTGADASGTCVSRRPRGRRRGPGGTGGKHRQRHLAGGDRGWLTAVSRQDLVRTRPRRGDRRWPRREARRGTGGEGSRAGGSR